MGHESVKVEERKLGLEMRVLAQVTTGVTLLGTERLLDAEDVAQTRETCLEVELRALREVRVLAIVAELEQGRSTLDLRLDHARRRHLQQADLLVRLAERAEEGRAHFEDVGRRLASDDEVTSICEQVGIALLHSTSATAQRAQSLDTYGRDLVEERLVAARSLAQNSPPVRRELVVVRRSLALGECLDGSRDLDGRLKREGEGVVALRLRVGGQCGST